MTGSDMESSLKTDSKPSKSPATEGDTVNNIGKLNLESSVK